MVLYYLLLAPCLSLWNSSTFYLPTDYPYCTQLSSTGPLHVSLVLYYLLLAPCLSRWYSTIFYWLPSYPCGTLTSTVPLPIPMLLYYLPIAHTYPFGTLLSSTGAMPIPIVLKCLLLVPCLYLWYSTVFYCPTAYTYGSLLSSNGPCLSTWYTFIFF